MRIIAIANQKGGSGKTTTTMNLGACLSALGYRTLLLDLDPQGSLTHWMGLRNAVSWSELFDSYKKGNALLESAVETHIAGLFLIPSSPKIRNLPREIAQGAKTQFILREQFRTKNELPYDFVLLDCPPGMTIWTVNALIASDDVLIPVATQYLGINALVELLKAIKTVQEKANPNLSLLGILGVRFRENELHSSDVLEILDNNFGDLVLQTLIREDEMVAESPAFRESVFDSNPDSPGAQDYRMLAEEIITIKEGVANE